MKRRFRIAIFILFIVLSMVLSCDSSLERMEEGDVNYNIFPYLKFTLSSDRTYFIASVVEGATLKKVYIPGAYHTKYGEMPVKEFAGFEDIDDSVLLEEVIMNEGIERIREGALDKAENLKSVRIEVSGEASRWGFLPSLVKEGYIFLGWKAGDSFVYSGMEVEKGNEVAVPVWESIYHTEHSYTEYKAKDEKYHVLVCEWCGVEEEGTEEEHVFVKTEEGEKCIKCGYILPYSGGGFNVTILDKTPMGHIELTTDNLSSKTFTFIDDKTEFPALKLEWYVDERLVKTIDLTSQSDYSFTASTPYPMTYTIKCRYSNAYAVGSSTLVVSGGDST